MSCSVTQVMQVRLIAVKRYILFLQGVFNVSKLTALTKRITAQ